MNTLSRTVIFVLLLFSFFSAHAATTIDADIEVSTTWNKEGNPYVIMDRINVHPGATLTINPGVVVKVEPSPYSSFKNGISIFSGSILAMGSDSEPIIFTSAYDDTVGGDTDYYEDCYESIDEEGNITGPETCDRYDIGDSVAGDWEGIYLSESTGSVLKNVFIKYTGEGLTLYKSKITLEKMHIDEVDEALTLYETSEVLFSDLVISNIYSYAASIFNDTVLIGTGLKVNNMFNTRSGVMEVFNNSMLDIKNASFKDCTSACVTVFDGDDYAENPSRVVIEDSVFEGGLESGLLTFSRNVIPMVIQIKNSVFKNFGLFAIENYTSTTTVQAKDNEWGSVSGPYHETLNPEGQGDRLYGLVDFDPWIGKDQDLSPEQYYAKITNIPSGVAYLYDAPSTTATLVKTLPNDWVVKVISKVDEDGSPIISGGYRWYKVEDPTDKTLHYMISGTGAKSTHLPYEETKQAEYENISVDNLSGTTTAQKNKRRESLLDVLTHYYNNTDTHFSLYSSDDITKLSSLKTNGFPKEVIMAMIAQEIGIAGFDNELVSYDYGHGIMQVTMDAHTHENPTSKYYGFDKNGSDPRGRYSLVTLKKCRELNSEEYKKCYENTSTYNTKRKPYSSYDHNINNPKYKQYANTVQSIYANVKDGLGILVEKNRWAKGSACKKGDYSVEGYIFTCQDLTNIKTVWAYNGVSTSNEHNYMREISTKLKTLSTFYPGISYSNTDKLIEKLEVANRYRRVIKAYSPVEISVIDSSGNIVGMVSGEDITNMPNGIYDKDTESVVIFFPNDNYTYKVVGDSTGGTYGLDINNYSGTEIPVSFKAFDIPIIPGEIHTYTVDQAKLTSNKPDAVTVQIDINADGEPEKIIKTGDTLSSVAPYDFYFKKPIVSGGVYRINKELLIKIKVVKEEKDKIKIPYPKFTITRVSDGYVLPINNKKLDEDDEEDNDDRRYYKKFFKGHNKNYTLKLSKNTLTEGEWKIEVSIGDKLRHSIVINMVK